MASCKKDDMGCKTVDPFLHNIYFQRDTMYPNRWVLSDSIPGQLALIDTGSFVQFKYYGAIITDWSDRSSQSTFNHGDQTSWFIGSEFSYLSDTVILYLRYHSQYDPSTNKFCDAAKGDTIYYKLY